MSDKEKRFDNWKVDCNECVNYWTNGCDGVSKGQQKPCNSFLAQRSFVIPAEIKSLRKQLKGVIISSLILAVALLLHLILH